VEHNEVEHNPKVEQDNEVEHIPNAEYLATAEDGLTELASEVLEAELAGELEGLDVPIAPAPALLSILTSERATSRHARLAVEPSEDMDTKDLKFEHTMLREPASMEAINTVARLRATSRAYLTGKDGNTSRTSLRSALFEYSERVSFGFVPVLYHDQALAQKLGLQMRRDSGIAKASYDFVEDADYLGRFSVKLHCNPIGHICYRSSSSRCLGPPPCQHEVPEGELPTR
jgi:hypothetical protein